MNSSEAAKLQNYLRARFNNQRISLKPRDDDRMESSAEVSIHGEHLGVIFKDTEDGEICYHLQMTILDMDLE